MNEPEFKMFFKGSKEDFIEIFNFSSKVIKEKQPENNCYGRSRRNVSRK